VTRIRATETIFREWNEAEPEIYDEYEDVENLSKHSSSTATVSAPAINAMANRTNEDDDFNAKTQSLSTGNSQLET
jgi:hypothetical protein